MQARDTVMEINWRRDHDWEKMLETQAGISFTAGQEDEYKRWIKALLYVGIMVSQPQQLKRIIPCIKEDEKKAGIRGVVEFLANNYSEELYSAGLFQVVVPSEEWQAKLKEWGIKEG